jgi:hypothetical protein
MRVVSTLVIVSSLAVPLAGCGGGGADPIPLLSGSVSGEYAGDAFTASFGFATVYEEIDIIALGDGNLHCGSPESANPPDGTNAILALPALEVGSYTNVEVHLYQNIDEFSGFGTTGAVVTLSSVTAESVAGDVDFSFTTTEGETYRLAGTFEVSRCAQ